MAPSTFKVLRGSRFAMLDTESFLSGTQPTKMESLIATSCVFQQDDSSLGKTVIIAKKC